jgi:hypothetical protein
VSRGQRNGSPRPYSEFLDRSRYFIQVAPQLCSRRYVDPNLDPLLLRESSSAGNRMSSKGFKSLALSKIAGYERLKRNDGEAYDRSND